MNEEIDSMIQSADREDRDRPTDTPTVGEGRGVLERRRSEQLHMRDMYEQYICVHMYV